MPITPYLAGQAFDPDAIKTMSDVLERVCAELGVKLYDGKENPAADIVAEKIIECWQRGLRAPTALYLSAMGEFKSGDHKPN